MIIINIKTMNKKLELLKNYYIEAKSQDEVDEINDFFLSCGAVKGSKTPSIHYPYRFIDIANVATGNAEILEEREPITLEEAKALVEEKTFPRKMYVSDVDPKCGEKHERIVLWENTHGNPKYPFVTVQSGMENDFATGKPYENQDWRYAKEIEPEISEREKLLNEATELLKKALELTQRSLKIKAKAEKL
jgi:hypothetical protein